MFVCKINVENKALEEIVQRLHEAEDEIIRCYDDLRQLKVLTIEEAASEQG